MHLMNTNFINKRKKKGQSTCVYVHVYKITS